MMDEDFSADLTWIDASSPALADDRSRFSQNVFLSAVLLLPVQVQLRGAPENHVARATVQKLRFGF